MVGHLRVTIAFIVVGVLTPGVPGPTSKLSLCAPAQMGWRKMEHKGGNCGFMLSCARVGALAVGVTSVREGERESRTTTLPYEGPDPSFYRCKERVQVYNMLTCSEERSQSPMYMPAWLSERC
jgi:hypothetical protein